MSFKIDVQTFADLNIFSERKDDNSIFKYFDKTQTYKAKDMLMDFMKNPVNDINELRNRNATIKYILEKPFEYKISSKNLDFIEYYINENTTILKNNFIDSLANKIEYILKPRNEYYVISKGIEILKKHLIYLSLVVKSIESTDLPLFLQYFVKEVKGIIEKKNINLVLAYRKKLWFRKISQFDFLFRELELESIKKVLDLTYKLDVFFSISEAAKNSNFSFPEFIIAENPNLNIKELFHPLLDTPISNSIKMGDQSKLCFLTGANMSGKSTFLKSIGLCVYLAHIGFPVPAKSMEITVFNGLLSTINLADSINKGYSHYYSEVKRVKETALLIKEHKKVIVIFDELFRGTNVKDAFDASLLITSAFSKIQNSLFFVSTHITEIAEELEKHKNIFFKYFESGLNGEIPIYNYKLKSGVSKERLGLQIVKNEKILEVLDEITNEI